MTTVDSRQNESEVTKMQIRGVTESIIEHLRDQIVSGEFNAGQRLNENHLATTIGVSRPPLREAFRVLQHERLIDSIPRKGTYVTPMTLEDLQQVCRVRVMIECCAVDLLEEQRVKDIPEVQKALQDASAMPIPRNKDVEQQLLYVKALAGFHEKLVEASGNYWLIHFYHAIASSLARYQFLYVIAKGAVRRSIQEHQQIIDHIKRGAYDKAKSCLTEHIGRVAGSAEIHLR